MERPMAEEMPSNYKVDSHTDQIPRSTEGRDTQDGDIDLDGWDYQGTTTVDEQATEDAESAIESMVKEDGDAVLEPKQDSKGNKGKRVIGPKTLMRLLEKQQYRCAISGLPLTPDTMALDHKVPRSAGGTETLDNYQFVRADVNAMKGSMGMRQFIGICKQIASRYDKV